MLTQQGASIIMAFKRVFPLIWRCESKAGKATYLIARTKQQAVEVFFQVFPDEVCMTSVKPHANLPLDSFDPLKNRVIAAHIDACKFLSQTMKGGIIL